MREGYQYVVYLDFAYKQTTQQKFAFRALCYFRVKHFGKGGG